MKYVNLFNPNKGWDLKIAKSIITQLDAYAKSFKLEDVVITEIEDQTEEDPVNQRYDVYIKYTKDGHVWDQKFLYLKGELIDGKTFHERYDEFYRRKEAV